jgi:stage III sporulation protein SpoIIIAA
MRRFLVVISMMLPGVMVVEAGSPAEAKAVREAYEKSVEA